MFNLFSYIAYNLNIRSSIEFPGLHTEKFRPDVIITTKKIDTFPQGGVVLDNQYGLTLIRISNKDVGILFENKPFLRIRNGNEIIINSDLNTDLEKYKFFILNQGMGILLHQRNFLVLHGSAVSMSGRGIAFIGTSGAGKSTTAALLNSKGHSLLTDDVLAIKFEKDNVFVLPSFPFVKLEKDVVKMLSNKKNSISQIHHESQKYCYTSNEAYSSGPVPLKRIYMLKKGDENEIFTMEPQNSLMEIVKHSYALRLFNKEDQSTNLFQCNDLIKNVPVKCLKRGHALENYEELLSKIEKDVLN